MAAAVASAIIARSAVTGGGATEAGGAASVANVGRGLIKRADNRWWNGWTVEWTDDRFWRARPGWRLRERAHDRALWLAWLCWPLGKRADDRPLRRGNWNRQRIRINVGRQLLLWRDAWLAQWPGAFLFRAASPASPGAAAFFAGGGAAFPGA